MWTSANDHLLILGKIRTLMLTASASAVLFLAASNQKIRLPCGDQIAASAGLNANARRDRMCSSHQDETLDRTINQANHSGGSTPTGTPFMERLQQLFPAMR